MPSHDLLVGRPGGTPNLAHRAHGYLGSGQERTNLPDSEDRLRGECITGAGPNREAGNGPIPPALRSTVAPVLRARKRVDAAALGLRRCRACYWILGSELVRDQEQEELLRMLATLRNPPEA